MRDRKTRDSYQYRRSPHGKGPKLKARTSEKAGKRRRRRELLKGPRTSDLDRETESPRVERPEDRGPLSEVQSPTTKGPRDQSADVGESRKAPTS